MRLFSVALLVRINIDEYEIGENTNSFYAVNNVKQPLISTNATLKGIEIQPTMLSDFATEAGGVYHFKTKK